jgi:hypothetical protein
VKRYRPFYGMVDAVVRVLVATSASLALLVLLAVTTLSVYKTLGHDPVQAVNVAG